MAMATFRDGCFTLHLIYIPFMVTPYSPINLCDLDNKQSDILLS